MADIFSASYKYYDKADLSDEPTFFNTVGAQLGYQYQPLLDKIGNSIRFAGEADPNYVSTSDLSGYENYKSELIGAVNATHMKVMKRQLDENLSRRRTLAEASFTKQFMAGLFDPINAVALPFGGPMVGLGRSFARTGLSVGALQVGLEVARAPFDPLNTVQESALNVGSAFIMGGLIGTAFSVPATRRAKVYEQSNKVLNEMGMDINPLYNPTRKSATAERPFQQFADEQVEAIIEIAPKKLKANEDIKRRLLDEQEMARQTNDTETVKKNAKIIDKVDESTAKLNEEIRFANDERINRAKEDMDKTISDPSSIASSAWTDSFAYKFVTTPMKRVLQNKRVPDFVKRVMLDLAHDSGISLHMHKHGVALDPSAYQMAQMRNGEWVSVHDGLTALYEKEYKIGSQTFADVDIRSKAQNVQNFFGGQNKTYYDWITEVNRKRIKGEKPKTDAESEAIKLIDDYYSTWSKRLEETGMLGGLANAQNRLSYIELQMDRLSADIDAGLKRKGGQALLNAQESRMAKLDKERKLLESEVQYLKDKDFMPPNEQTFNPRYWDLDAIEKNIDGLKGILFQWYKKNPTVYVFDEAQNRYVKKVLSTKAGDIQKRVDKTVDTILGRKDATQEEQSFYGAGKSKHLRHREIDIPNHLVVDFIENNPINVMKTYNARIAPMYEFNAKFGRSIDDVSDEIELEMLVEGLSTAEINAVRRDILHMYDRVTGRVLKDPHSLDQQAATVLKDLAMLNYLGSAGFSTLPDFAKIIMEHEMGTVFKGLFGVMNDNRVRLSSREARIAGEAIEILQGDAHLRLTEYMNNNPLNNGFMNKLRSGFFLLNGLAPMTNMFKRLDAIMRGHTLIDYSVKLKEGKATAEEIEYLARYNIDSVKARKIAESSWEQTENGLYLPNTEKWADVGITENFRVAMNSGIMNTILMGTPADKPIAVDGVFYIPMHIAQKFGMKQDTRIKGYARVENGLLGLPFQFMSYSFAAANKITASLAQGQIKNRSVAVLASMGLGYMSMELKYKDYQMEQMTLADKIARSFDASGIAALYSDLGYTAMNTSLAMGGPNIGMGFINPKFPQEQNYVDAFTSLAGAGPSWAVDTGRAVGEFVQGNFGEGAYQMMGQMPAANMWLWKDDLNQMGRALRTSRY